MKLSRKFLLLAILTAVLFAVPLTTFARKQIFRASMNTASELHEVVGSNGRGATVIGLVPEGVQFQVSGNRLSGTPTSVQIHGLATPDETAPAVVTLCGEPAPAVFAECNMENGLLVLQGHIPPQLLNMTPRQFMDALDDGLLYVNVYTELNPDGEIRGQLYPR